MNELTLRNKIRKLSKDKRGVTLVEYVMILIVVLVAVVAAYKALAQKIDQSSQKTVSAF